MRALMITLVSCAVAVFLLVLVVHTGGFGHLFHVITENPGS